jgi:Asp-tRNA(Asn)/Glu-tRNA(Gln) amidotransferase A subunit family amidase
VQLCAGLGHSIAELYCDIAWEPVRQAARLIAATEARVRLAERARQLGQALREADVEPLTWRLLETHKTASATDYQQALHVLYRTGRQFARAMQEYDVVISPTVPMPPVELHGMSPTTPEGLMALQRATGFTQIANIAGHPAMSVPLCWNAAGLPIGIQFIGRYGDEATLFRLAGQLEDARPWFARRPTLVRGIQT